MSIKLVNSMDMFYRQTVNQSYSLKGVAFDNHIFDPRFVILSSFAIILTRKKALVALHLLSS